MNPSPSPIRRRLLRAKEAAEILGFSVKQLYNMSLGGTLPLELMPIHVGKRCVRWDLVRIENWINQQSNLTKEEGT